MNRQPTFGGAEPCGTISSPRRTPIDHEVRAERQVTDCSSAHHSRDRVDAIDDALHVGQTLWERLVPRRRLQTEGEDVVRPEAGIDVLQIPERPQHQSGADAKDDGECDLNRDQCAERAPSPRRVGAARLAQQRLQTWPRGEQRRNHRDENGHGDRCEQHGRQHVPVESDFTDARHLWRNRRDQRRQREVGNSDSRKTAKKREHGLFDDDLLHKPGTRCPKRRAHGHFSHPLDRSSEDKRAEIDRREHQDQPDGSQQNQQRRSHVARHRLLQGRHSHCLAVFVRLSQIASHRRRECLEFARCQVNRDLRLQTRDRLREGRLEVVRSRVGWHRCPQVVAGPQHFESWWHHADDDMRLLIELDGASKNVRISAKAAAPQTVRQDRDASGALARLNRAPERSGSSQRSEQLV